jgi:hypothetical protein
VSEQDFFFDEDEQPKQPAKQSAKSSDSTKSSKPAAASSTPGSVTTTVTALVGVVALLIGVILGIFVGQSLATPTVSGNGGISTPTQGAPQQGGMGQGGTGGEQAAPQLTPEQMQGGELPQGHPDINSMNASGSAETTSK